VKRKKKGFMKKIFITVSKMVFFMLICVVLYGTYRVLQDLPAFLLQEGIFILTITKAMVIIGGLAVASSLLFFAMLE